MFTFLNRINFYRMVFRRVVLTRELLRLTTYNTTTYKIVVLTRELFLLHYTEDSYLTRELLLLHDICKAPAVILLILVER